ncbi:hypothetical protein MKX01_010291 [Papaver californicum]|nr:hypothetical protein MKX01_010291 [Papaver californicum]
MNTDKEKFQYIQMEGLEYNPNPYSSCSNEKTMNWSCSKSEVIEESKKRCEVVTNQIHNLSPHSKITDACKQILVRLVHSELKFLNHLSASSNHSSPISVNIGYLESIVHILQQPFINGVSRRGKKDDSFSKGVHVDIVCNLDKSPVWFFIGMICETVHSEFKELVSVCGGANERLRADQLLKHLSIVPDAPSVRMMGLPTTRKIAAKNKVVFGTGDYWRAPTLTANMGFLRAISQTGMSLLTLEHRPRALTGD